MTWIRNTDGKPDAVLTFTIAAVVVVLVRVALGGLSLAFGAVTLGLEPLADGAIAAVLTPTLGAYVARRYTAARFPRRGRA